MKARDLCSYTIKIATNKKIFIADYQEALTDKIIQAAIDIHTREQCSRENVGRLQIPQTSPEFSCDQVQRASQFDRSCMVGLSSFREARSILVGQGDRDSQSDPRMESIRRGEIQGLTTGRRLNSELPLALCESWQCE